MTSKSSLYYQLTLLLEAGIALPNALDSLQKQGSSSVQSQFRIVLDQLNTGELPHIAFQAANFSPLELALIEIAGQTGDYPGCFRHLYQYHEQLEKLNKQLKAGFAYPILLLFLTPTLLNLYLIFSKGLFAYLKVVLFSYTILIGSFLVLVWLHKKMQNFVPYASFLNHLPLIGALRFRFAHIRFCSCLSRLLGAGVSSEQAIRLAISALQNPVYEKQFQGVLLAIRSRQSFSESLAIASFFPTSSLQMIQTGEVSGNLPENLHRLATVSQQEAEQLLNYMVKILPLVLYLGVAGYVGYKIVLFYVGYFKGLSLP